MQIKLEKVKLKKYLIKKITEWQQQQQVNGRAGNSQKYSYLQATAPLQSKLLN